jgi:predicted ATP-grasp superfamily ATP-dependent carboligase
MPLGLPGLFTHSARARAASAGAIASSSMPPVGDIGTGTARHPARIAPISYVG